MSLPGRPVRSTGSSWKHGGGDGLHLDPSLTLCAQGSFMPHNNAVNLALEYPPHFIDEETEAQTR